MIEVLKRDADDGFLDKDNCHWDSILGFCGCGDTAATMLYIKEMLEKLNRQEWGEYEDMPYMFFVYWADREGYTDHGNTVRCSWLTAEGEKLLKDIKACIKVNKK